MLVPIHRLRTTLPVLMLIAASSNVWADDAPPPPMGVLIGKGQLGFLDSKGNSDVIDNTNPPAPLKKVDTVATVNLQFAF